jgi:hypothetical protein
MDLSILSILLILSSGRANRNRFQREVSFSTKDKAGVSGQDEQDEQDSKSTDWRC